MGDSTGRDDIVPDEDITAEDLEAGGDPSDTDGPSQDEIARILAEEQDREVKPGE